MGLTISRIVLCSLINNKNLNDREQSNDDPFKPLDSDSATVEQ